MTSINPLAASATPAPQPAAGATLNQLDNTQTFLKLLVAQLKNQNPDNPADPTSFMTEIAQLTAVQSQTAMSAQEQLVAADSMIGRVVSGAGSSGSLLTGTVTSVLLNQSGPPTLDVTTGSGQLETLPLTAVTQVAEQAPGTQPTSSTPATGSTPSGGA